jgi:hypothetical protein
MDKDLKYTLKIDLGNDLQPYFLFENTAFGDLHG